MSGTAVICFFLGMMVGELLVIAITLGDIRRELRRR